MLNESKFLELYNRQKESGLNVKDFCANEGIAESTFYYWRKKFQKSRGRKDFIPLVVKSTQAMSAQHYSKGNQPVQDPGDIGENFLLEVVYPNRTKLRIKKNIDLNHLRALIYLYD